MDYQLTWPLIGLLIGTGLIAGFVNTLAAGGSFLTIPALMLLGLPADIANATNRISVFFQSVEAVRSFQRRKMLDTPAIMPMLVPTIIGSLVGSFAASYLPVDILKPVILITLISMAAAMVFIPNFVDPPEGTVTLSPSQSFKGFMALFIAGVYGGFIQAGVGFVLIAALCGVLRHSLVSGNALKSVATIIFTAVSLVIFIINEQIWWIPGLLMACGSIVGASLAVRFASAVPQKTLKKLLLLVVVLVCAAVWFKT